MEPVFPRVPPKTRGLKGTTGRRAVIGWYLATALTLLLRAVAPIACLRVAYMIATWSTWVVLLDAWAICEAVFILTCFYRAHALSRRRLPLAFPASERAIVLERIMDRIAKSAALTKCVDPADGSKVLPGRCDDDCVHTLLRGWQRGIPWSNMSSDDARSWLSWALFAAPHVELTQLQREEVSHAIEDLKKRTGVSFPHEYAVRNMASNASYPPDA